MPLFEETNSRSVGEIHTLLKNSHVGRLCGAGRCNKATILSSLRKNKILATVSINIYKIITLYD